MPITRVQARRPAVSPSAAQALRRRAARNTASSPKCATSTRAASTASRPDAAADKAAPPETARIKRHAQALWSIHRWGAKHLRLSGSIIRWEVLVVIARAEGTELSYGELEATVAHSHRALRYVVRDLEAMGYIRLRKSEADQRRVVIALTEAGRAVFLDYTYVIERYVRDLAPPERPPDTPAGNPAPENDDLP